MGQQLLNMVLNIGRQAFSGGARALAPTAATAATSAAGTTLLDRTLSNGVNGSAGAWGEGDGAAWNPLTQLSEQAGGLISGLGDKVAGALSGSMAPGSPNAPQTSVSPTQSAPSGLGGGGDSGLNVSNSTAPQIYPWATEDRRA